MTTRALSAALPLLVALGCSSAPAPDARGARTVNVQGEGPVEYLARAPEAEVDAFATRFGEHDAAGRLACCAAMVKDSPDLALEVLRHALRAGDSRVAESMARSLRAAGVLDASSSLAARAAAPDKHRDAWRKLAGAEVALGANDRDRAVREAKESRAAFEELKDAFGAADAELVALLAGDKDARQPAFARCASEARALLELASRAKLAGDPADASKRFLVALRFAQATRDLSLVVSVESERASFEAGLAPAELAAWLRHVATLALERKRPLVALRCAHDAQTIVEARTVQSRILVARAQLASGQAVVALETALTLAKEARDQGDQGLEATAVGLTGETLISLERPGDAAGAFERAAELARVAGDGDGFVRRTLNLVRAHLRRSEPGDAKVVLDRLERLLPETGRQAARCAVARACEQATRSEYAAMRVSLDRAIALAGASGDYETVEQALVLKRRLGALGA